MLQPPHREAFNDEQMYWVDRYRLLVVSPPNHGTLGLSSIVGWPLILYLVDSVILSTFLLPVCIFSIRSMGMPILGAEVLCSSWTLSSKQYAPNNDTRAL